MLILERKEGEKIKIGDNITIKVVQIKGLEVIIGIDAPKDVKVHRQEIYDKIKSRISKGLENE